MSCAVASVKCRHCRGSAAADQADLASARLHRFKKRGMIKKQPPAILGNGFAVPTARIVRFIQLSGVAKIARLAKPVKREA